ncbi:probable pectinesterase 53 [Actinidia eriantha]|uniref:probable pectinesterase 53 n=1 Tax=Actinidia eriantha TaxID=165200 RepID=UPI0025909960|nr:probable pectinesterase 53 [Actinidia eriantha]
MAPKLHFQCLLSLLVLSNLIFICFSLNLEREADYEKWISWHVNNSLKKMKQVEEGGSKIVDANLRNAEMNKTRISVSQDGTGDFKSIKEAIDSIPLHNTRRVILFIKPGQYREKIVIPRSMSFVTLLGDSSDPPTITGNDTASESGKTFNSATVAVNANYFVAANIKFENTAPHEDGAFGEQAVALRTSGNKTAFYNCSFYGSQDTLYDHKGFHYFKNCFIQGSVDFIFGYGRSLYENCQLNSIANKTATVTAQKRNNASLSSGFSFTNCKVTGTGWVYLGRAWGDHSRVIFSYTYMDSIVLPQGWGDWGDPKRDLQVYYAEYKCSGPGANFTGRVPWARQLTDADAKPFIGTQFIDGDTWLISP